MENQPKLLLTHAAQMHEYLHEPSRTLNMIKIHDNNETVHFYPKLPHTVFLLQVDTFKAIFRDLWSKPLAVRRREFLNGRTRQPIMRLVSWLS